MFLISLYIYENILLWNYGHKNGRIFQDITPLGTLKANQRFGRTCYLHLQSRRISKASCLLHAGFSLGLIFDPENGGDIFPQNVS
jgi:hypothetical protein